MNHSDLNQRLEEAASLVANLRLNISRLTHPPRILIADDSLEDRILLKRAVTKLLKCEIIEVPDGDSATHILASQEVDVIFLDMIMPPAGGLHVIEQMSDMDRKRLVVVTRLERDAREVVEAVRMGAIKIITKPVKDEDLKAIFGQHHEPSK